MKVAILGVDIFPSPNEAIAKQYLILSKEIPANIFSINSRDVWLNGVKFKAPKFVRKFLFLFLAFWLSLVYDRLIIHSSSDSFVLKFTNKRKTIHFLSERSKNLKKYKLFSHKFPLIITQSKRIWSKLNSPNSIFSYPLVESIEGKSNPEEFTFLFASAPKNDRAYNLKGVDLLLDSFELVDSGKLLILWRGACKKRILKKIKENKNSDRIILIDSKVEIEKYLSISSCIVIPFTSSYPAYPSSAIEGFSFNLPVVMTNCLELGELVENSKAGIVCQPSIENFSRAMNEIQVRNFSSKLLFNEFFSKKNISKLSEAIKKS